MKLANIWPLSITLISSAFLSGCVGYVVTDDDYYDDSYGIIAPIIPPAVIIGDGIDRDIHVEHHDWDRNRGDNIGRGGDRVTHHNKIGNRGGSSIRGSGGHRGGGGGGRGGRGGGGRR